MKHCLFLVILVMAVAIPAMTGLCSAGEATSGLNVYQPIPGITPSTRFSVRVTDAATRAKWFDLFTMETVGPAGEGPDVGKMYGTVTGHSSSWATFEYDAPVEVKIKKLSPGPIDQCVVKPRSREISCTISADKTEVTLIIPVRKVPREKITTASNQAPVNITAEINGQSKETISIFASPHLARKPSLSDPGVLRVDPGTNPPTTGSWHTLYFMPGIHQFGKMAYAMQANRSYYIPGDAWIESPFTGGGDNTRIFGMGVMSQRTILRVEIDSGDANKMMTISGRNAVLEGLTLVDSKCHTLFGSGSNESNPVVIRNVKLHNWMGNTDGIHFFSPGIAEDCFFRTQDDMHYFYLSSIFRRMVYWKDETFGAELVMPGIKSGEKPHTCREEDSDSIYYNCKWNGANMDGRDDFPEMKVYGGTIDGYRIERPGDKGQRPFIDLSIDEGGAEKFIKGILFKDIHVLNEVISRIEISGQPGKFVEDITFQDIRIGNRWVEDFSLTNFSHLENARNLRIIRNGKVVATHPPSTKGTPPTIATQASASPSTTVTGTSATLSAMGASAAGEDKLAYIWAATGTPPGGSVTFGVNGTNAAKTTPVTFSKIGTYTLQVTVLDGSGQNVTSNVVTITVNPTLTDIAVSSPSYAIFAGASVALTAQARDQFKDAMSVQPTFAWTIDAGGVGTVNNSGVYKAPASGTGAATIRATTTSGPVVSGTAAVSYSPGGSTPPTIAAPAIASPNPVTGTTATLSVLGASAAGEEFLTYHWATTGTPPAGVTFSVNDTNTAKNTVVTFSKIGTYNLEVTIRDGSGQTVTSPVTITVKATLTKIVVSPSSSAILAGATVALAAQARNQFGAAMAAQPTFAWSVDAAGSGSVNNSGVYTAPASGTSTATIRATTTSGPVMSGTAVVSFSPSTGTPPTIDTPASASPSTTVTGTTVKLSVKGATTAPAGEASLTYTWATAGTPPADVTFSVNGTNAAKNTVVTFSKIGTYNLEVTIRDGSDQTVTSPVTITVNATLTEIVVSPSSSAILASATVALTAQARNQFGAAMAAQPTFAWSIDAAGSGSVNNSGVYTAPASGTGTATIRATTTSGPVMSGTTMVSYSPSDTGTDTSGGDSGGGGGGCGLGAGFTGLLLGIFLLLRMRLCLVDRAQ